MLAEDFECVFSHMSSELEQKTSDLADLKMKSDELGAKFSRAADELDAMKPTVHLLHEVVKTRTVEEKNFRQLVHDLAEVIMPNVGHAEREHEPL